MSTGDILIMYVVWFVMAFAVAGYLLKNNS